MMLVDKILNVLSTLCCELDNVLSENMCISSNIVFQIRKLTVELNLEIFIYLLSM